MLRQRLPREENEPHRKFVASLGCLICGATNTQAAHVRYGEPEIGKPQVGLQEKSDDCFVVPLCVAHHAAQHNWNERDWWAISGIDPIKLALRLYSVTGDYTRGEVIVSACREQRAA